MNALTPKEVKITQMALQTFMEDNEAISKDQSIPLTPQARADMEDMYINAKSAYEKIAKASGYAVKLDPYNEGDEKDFLTKQS